MNNIWNWIVNFFVILWDKFLSWGNSPVPSPPNQIPTLINGAKILIILVFMFVLVLGIGAFVAEPGIKKQNKKELEYRKKLEEFQRWHMQPEFQSGRGEKWDY